MNNFKVVLMMFWAAGMGTNVPLSAQAQVSASDSVMNHANKSRLSVGGYGEVAYSREFFSDNEYRFA